MKMWDGRFSKPSSSLMEEFNNSLPVDIELIEEDIKGSIAWAKALNKANILTEEETSLITKELQNILSDYHNNKLLFTSSDEDVHMAVERILTERIGDAGKKLHTGRSRNDQVATDFRLYTMNKLTQITELIFNLQEVLYKRACQEKNVLIPGYTHLQQAQVVVLAHYWLSLFFILEREKKRFTNAINNCSIMPLGNGAIAGSGFKIDRTYLAKELGFNKVSENSMDGIASRDFVLEALFVISSLATTLSRYAEDLIIWSTKEFGFIELDDAWSTGSSMMPQKKNPDSLELIRGKTGRFVGNLMRFATTLKGLGLTYFKDLQEDKEPFIDSAKQITLVLKVFTNVIDTLTVKTDAIEKKLDPFLLATDLADFLVEKGMPFRNAHKVVGKITAYCIKNNIMMNKLTLDELKNFSELFDDSVKSVFTWQTALEHRDIEGGTGPKSIEDQLKKAEFIIKHKKNL